MFQKRWCELNGEEFHIFITPDKTVSSKLHVALLFGYIRYHDKELSFWGVITQLLSVLILLVFYFRS